MPDIFKITLVPEDVDDRVAYLVFKDGYDLPAEDIADDGELLDPILCDNEGYVVSKAEKVYAVPGGEYPYEF